MYIIKYIISILSFTIIDISKVASFYQKTPKDIIFRSGFFSKITNDIRKELYEPSNLSFILININNHDSLQIIYTLSSLYLINVILNEDIQKNKKLNNLIYYKYGKKIAYNFILIINIIFIKNVGHLS